MADAIETIPEMIRYRGVHEPDIKVFDFYNKNGHYMEMTARDVWLMAGRFANRLREYNFVPGDVIANGLPNSPERLVTDFGVILAGCILVNCQIVEKDGSNFFNVARISKCKGLIMSSRSEDEVYKLITPFCKTRNSNTNSTITKNSLDYFEMSIPQAPTCAKVIGVKRQPNNSLLEDLKHCNEEPFCVESSPSDLVVLFATSGSTGYSKLVPHTNEIFFRQGRLFPANRGIRAFTDRSMGWVGGFPFDYLVHGSSKCVQDQLDGQCAIDVLDVWHVIAMSGCQGAALMPGEIYRLIDIFQKEPPEFKIGFIVTGGQAMKEKMMKALGLFCHAIVVSYGASEGGIYAYKAITDPSQFKDYLCGQKTGDVEWKIVDDDENELAAGQVGNLRIKTPRILQSYYNLETKLDRSATHTSDGYFKTGDRAKIDKDGNLYCYGRAGELVYKNGTIIYLSWPEEILNKSPLIQDSSIVAVEEEDNDQDDVSLCAYVVPSLGVDLSKEQVVDYFEESLVCDSQRRPAMPNLKYVRIVDFLPTLPSGKVNKLLLKKLLRKELSSSSSSGGSTSSTCSH